MFATTKTVTIVLIWITCSYCSAAVQDDKGSGARHRENVRTRSSSRQHRTKYPTAAVAAGPDDNNSRQINSLRDYLVQKPTDIYKTLLHAGLTVVQAGMDTFGDVSARVYRTITPDRQSYSDTRQRSTDGSKPSNPGLVQTVAKSVVNMVGTGISGMKEVTDLGLLLGNIGTQKIRSKLNGDTGNQEIFQMLIKYVASRVGVTTKGDVKQFVDDIGTVSTFMARDHKTTKAMSTIMERLMNESDVCVSMVRLCITALRSSPSTSCLLDDLPLSASDIRMLFNVFVSSNGYRMIKTIAGMVSEFTTGPETKEFLEAILGMTSLFSSFGDNDDKAASKGLDEPQTSVIGSLKNFFTGDSDDDNTVKSPQKSKALKKKKKKKITPKPKKEIRNDMEPLISKDMEDWFENGDDDGFGGNTVMKTATRGLQDADRDGGGAGGGEGGGEGRQRRRRRRRDSSETTKIPNAKEVSGERNYGKKRSKKNANENADNGQNDFAP